jgi:hypothetical protein
MQLTIPEAQQVSSLSPTTLNVLCYGRNGTGKTEFAATWPKPVLFIDSDRGITTVTSSPRIKDKDQIFVVPVSDSNPNQKIPQPIGYLTIKQVLTDFHSTGKFGVIEPKTIVIDTLTTAASYAMSFILHQNRHVGQQPTLPDWGGQIRAVLDLITIGVSLNCNFIVTAHEQYLKDELSGRVWCVPLITGKLAQEIGLYFDELYHANVKEIGGKHSYIMETKATGLVTAKSRLDLPSTIESSYSAILAHIQKGGQQNMNT